MTSICLLGLGEVGQIIGHDFRARGVQDISAWDPKFAQSTSSPSRAVRAGGYRAARNAAEAVTGADIVISAVTAGQTVDAARAAAKALRPGITYLDLNSTAPGTKMAAAAIVEAKGATYVEGAVMAPVPPKRLATPILLGGGAARAFVPVAKDLGFSDATHYSDQIGAPSAVKMCRSVIIKGLEALFMESMLTARHYGVEKDVIASLHDLFSNPDWKNLPQYMISRSIEHGVRRAEEMREAAQTVLGARIRPLMTEATVARQERAPQFKAALSRSGLGEMLDEILKQALKIKEPGSAV